MPSPEHTAYQARVLDALRELATDPDRRRDIDRHANAMLVLWHVDLEPARPILELGYRGDRRSEERWCPVVLLRCLLLGALLGCPNPNDLAPELRCNPVLRAIVDVICPPDGSRRAASPSIGVFYSFFHRLHDGTQHTGPPVGERPSDHQRRRAMTPRPPWHARPELDGKEDRKPAAKKRKKASKKVSKHRRRRAKTAAKAKAKRPNQPKKTAQAALDIARALQDTRNPADLTQRLLEILWACGVVESAEKGLLGDVHALITSGDGSPLETNAAGLGHKLCPCSRRVRCDCPRRFSDPDATRGYDSYRKKYVFGHWFYEVAVGSEGHDLPLGLGLFPAHYSDFYASITVTERLYKHLRDRTDGWKMATHSADCGEDGRANHEYLRERDIKPVISISKSVPATHPDRPDVHLSQRGIPLCDAKVEMASWGTGGKDRPQFVCPVKARKLEHCPLAPKDDQAWLCQPGTRLGPQVTVSTKQQPRLHPEISRNSRKYKKLYAIRTSCERSNGVKKETLHLNRCRHRRWSFWVTRLYLAALLQHAKAWVAGMDARTWVAGLLGEGPGSSQLAEAA